jgi:hypothetical protein
LFAQYELKARFLVFHNRYATILVILIVLVGRGSEVQFEPADPPGHV